MFKVWDKVICIYDYWVDNITKWLEYEVIGVSWSSIKIVDNHWWYAYYSSDRFEPVKEDKLPHELLWLRRLWYIKVNKNDPLWDRFWKRYEKFYNHKWSSEWEYFWFDSDTEQWVNACDDEGYWKEIDAKLITLAERDRIVNKKPSQTKKLSKPIRSCEHNWSIYKEDTIDWVSIKEMKATRDNINSKLITHRNLFDNPKKNVPRQNTV